MIDGQTGSEIEDLHHHVHPRNSISRPKCTTVPNIPQAEEIFGFQTAEHGIEVDISQNIVSCAHSLRPRKSNQGVRFYSVTCPPPIHPIISDPGAGPSTEPTINTQTAEYVPDSPIISEPEAISSTDPNIFLQTAEYDTEVEITSIALPTNFGDEPHVLLPQGKKVAAGVRQTYRKDVLVDLLYGRC